MDYNADFDNTKDIIDGFLTAEERFNAEKSYLLGCGLRMLRRFSRRILDECGHYDPYRVSVSEIVQLAGLNDPDIGSQWLSELNIPEQDIIDNQLAQLEETIRARIDVTSAYGLDKGRIPEEMQAIFSLSEIELHLLFAIAVPQLDNDMLRLYQFIYGQTTTIFPVRFYCELLADSSSTSAEKLALFSPQGTLRSFALIEMGNHPNWGNKTPIFHAPVYVADRIATRLRGIELYDLPHHMHIWKCSCASQLQKQYAKLLTKAIRMKGACVGIFGPKGMGQRECVLEYAQTVGRTVLGIELPNLTQVSDDLDWESTIRLWFREAKMQRALLYFDATQWNPQIDAIHKFHSILCHYVCRHDDCIVFDAIQPHPFWHDIFGNYTEIEIAKPSQSLQPELWKNALLPYLKTTDSNTIISGIAQSYCLTPQEMKNTIDTAMAHYGIIGDDLTGEMLNQTICQERSRRFEGLATLKPTPKGIHDVVLDDELYNTIETILNVARYEERVLKDWDFLSISQSNGLCVLFSGPPGTGKTLMAGIIAHELRRALLVVDLSKVIDKYIGETEKRLAKIFDAAEQTQAVLLFDEADSMFSKRTTVKSSNDRYANLEVNFLLQRLEAYSGISILTTNLATSLDEALARRIQYKLAFPVPDAKQRAKIWQLLQPPKAPSESIDFLRLGESFEMSGGHIKNAIYRASIIAASNALPLSTDLLWDAGLAEYRSLGHVVCDNPHSEEDMYH